MICQRNSTWHAVCDACLLAVAGHLKNSEEPCSTVWVLKRRAYEKGELTSSTKFNWQELQPGQKDVSVQWIWTMDVDMDTESWNDIILCMSVLPNIVHSALLFRSVFWCISYSAFSQKNFILSLSSQHVAKPQEYICSQRNTIQLALRVFYGIQFSPWMLQMWIKLMPILRKFGPLDIWCRETLYSEKECRPSWISYFVTFDGCAIPVQPYVDEL